MKKMMSLPFREKQNIKQLINDLYGAFSWKDSPQGKVYWMEVVENLQKLVKNRA